MHCSTPSTVVHFRPFPSTNHRFQDIEQFRIFPLTAMLKVDFAKAILGNRECKRALIKINSLSWADDLVLNVLSYRYTALSEQP